MFLDVNNDQFVSPIDALLVSNAINGAGGPEGEGALRAGWTSWSLFTRELARWLRLWLMGVPAGVGFATLKATLKLCVGVPPDRSGVFSAGKGPAMRAPILGAALDDLHSVQSYVRKSTRITHTDPKAEYGAFAVAAAAHLASRGKHNASEFLITVSPLLDDGPARELRDLLAQAAAAAAEHHSTDEFASSLGLQRGVSGYMCLTV